MAAGIQSRGRLSIPGLRKRLAQFDTPAYRTELAQLCAAAALKLVMDGFRRSVDPYGTAWERLKSRKGKPLLDTGRLRASFAVRPAPGGFSIDSTASYGKYQQYGTDPFTRRARMQPVGKRGRFISHARAAKLKRVVNVRALPGGVNPGIPARPMVPTPDQGGLPFKWQRIFRKEAVDLAKRNLEGVAA